MYNSRRITGVMYRNYTNRFLFSFLFSMKLSICSIWIYLCWTTLAWAQPPQVRATLDKTEAQIGDYIRLQLQAEYSAKQDFHFPKWGEKWDSLSVIEVQPKDSTWLSNDRLKATQNIIISGYKAGMYRLSPLTFSYGMPNTLLNNIMTDSLFVNIDAPNIDPQADIKSIKQPIQVVANRWLLIVIVLGVLTIIGALFWRWKRNKKHQKAIQPATTPTPLPAHELALKALQQLDQQRLWQQQQIKPYYTALTDILRQYLHQRYDIVTAEATSDEILQASQQHLSTEQQSELQQILYRADAVKFAKAEPLPQEHIESREKTEQFVRHTRLTEKTNETV